MKDSKQKEIELVVKYYGKREDTAALTAAINHLIEKYGTSKSE